MTASDVRAAAVQIAAKAMREKYGRIDVVAEYVVDRLDHKNLLVDAIETDAEATRGELEEARRQIDALVVEVAALRAVADAVETMRTAAAGQAPGWWRVTQVYAALDALLPADIPAVPPGEDVEPDRAIEGTECPECAHIGPELCFTHGSVTPCPNQGPLTKGPTT